MDAKPESVPAGRIPRVRAFLALLVVVVLFAGSLAYHDGVVGVDSLASATEPGDYRVRGVIESWDASAESFRFRSGSEQRDVHWNVTKPHVGETVVIDLHVSDDLKLEALSLSRALVF